MNSKSTHEDLVSRIEFLEKQLARHRGAEEALWLEEARLEALLKLNQMSDAPLKEITDFALEEAVRLTKSDIGYLAFMSEDEKTLTMHSWSKNAMKHCAVIDKPKVYPVETTGLWGETVRQRKPIITNDYLAPNPLKKGYPDGHVAICRHMNIPVFDGDRIVAVAGVGNKKAKYDDSDVRQMKLLMQGMWRLILKKWTDWELKESEYKFRKLVETVGCAIFIHRKDKILFSNPASESIFGYSRKELLSKNFSDLVHPEYRAMVRDRCLARQRGEQVPPRYEIKILKKGSQSGWCDFTFSIIEFEGNPAVLGIAVDITERKRAEEALEESELKFRQLSSYLLTAQENERKRISFELHDELGQSLMALKLQIGSIGRMLSSDQQHIYRECQGVLDDINQIVENIRRLIRDLSPAVLDDLGLQGAIRWMADDFAKLNGCKVSLHMDNINDMFSHEAQIILYRIFQEAFTNIGKHAAAARVSIMIQKFCDHVHFELLDNGKGFDTGRQLFKMPSEKSIGLAAMNERARMLGASFDIQSRAGEGTRIILKVPVVLTKKEDCKNDALSYCAG